MVLPALFAILSSSIVLPLASVWVERGDKAKAGQVRRCSSFLARELRGSLKVWQWVQRTIGVVPVAGMGVYWAETREGMGGIVVFWL